MTDADRSGAGLPETGTAHLRLSQTPELKGARRELRRSSQTSLRTRLLVAVSLTCAVLYAAIASPFYLLVRLNVAHDSEAVLREESRIVETLLRARTGSFEERLSSLPLGMCSLQLTGTNGVVREKSGPLAGQLPLSKAALDLLKQNGGNILETVETTSRQQLRVLTTLIELRGGPSPEPAFLQLGFSLEEKRVRMRATLWWFIVGGVLLIGLSDAAMLLVLNQWRRQFSDLCESARSIDLTGHSKQRLMVPTADAELAQLVGAFNGLLDRVEQAYAAQQRFVADASHEIRTPLTILRGEIDVILRRDRNASEYREVMQSNKEELERLSRLVDNMLTLALADTQEASPRQRAADLAAVAESACKRLRSLALENDIDLQCAAANPCPVAGERTDLERAVVNLIENAIHFSPRGQSVKICVLAEGREATVSVEDHGPGIPATDVGHIFDRFYRVDKARSRAYGGAGLGLAIVKTIVEAHGGRVDVQTELGKGTTLRIRIPLA